jgi:lysophospholipase L1-like esterase
MGPDAYPQQLDSLLGDTCDVRNFGVGGCTLLVKGDFPYRNEAALAEALKFNPHIVIMLLGTNDSKPRNWVHGDAFFQDYMDLIGLFRREGRNPVIFTAFPPPVYRTLAGINHAIIRDEIIPAVDSVRTAAATHLIDFYHPMLGKSRLFPDGVHPSAEGYALMARIAAEAVQDILPEMIREKENN